MNQVEMIVFTVADGLMSMTMLVLFIVPLSNHVKKLLLLQGNSTDGNASVHSTVIKNLAVSSVSIFLSLSVFIVFCTILVLYSIDDPESHYLFISALILPQTEVWVSLVLIHTLTLVWLPFELKKSASTERKTVDRTSKTKDAVQMTNTTQTGS
jgi:hypothetical protein